MYYGLVSGEVYFDTINILNPSIKATLRSIVGRMSPQNCRIAALFGSKSAPVCIIHDEKTEHIDYLVSAKNRNILESELKNLNLALDLENSDEAEESGLGDSLIDNSEISGLENTSSNEEMNEYYGRTQDDSPEIIEPNP